jgi:hypothetical protein
MGMESGLIEAEQVPRAGRRMLEAWYMGTVSMKFGGAAAGLQLETLKVGCALLG